jgi:ankyrin repeat protein
VNKGTPLQYAAANASGNITKFLLSRGALIDTGTRRYGNSLQACFERKWDEPETAEVLLKEGADVNTYSRGEGHGNAL